MTLPAEENTKSDELQTTTRDSIILDRDHDLQAPLLNAIKSSWNNEGVVPPATRLAEMCASEMGKPVHSSSVRRALRRFEQEGWVKQPFGKGSAYVYVKPWEEGTLTQQR